MIWHDLCSIVMFDSLGVVPHGCTRVLLYCNTHSGPTVLQHVRLHQRHRRLHSMKLFWMTPRNNVDPQRTCST